ncbi:MAG: acyl-CoA thioesterase [Acidimicrobiales bacterium]
MGTSGWEDLAVTPLSGGIDDGLVRFTATIDDRWMLLVVPQGGVAAALAARAMAATLDDSGQSLRSLTAVFAGQVSVGPVEIDVTVLRRGRSMSQLTATVRNPGAKAGLTAVAVFGAPRRGFEFTDLVFPDVEPPESLRSYRDPVPDGVDFEFDRPPMPFWEEIVECRPATGRPPWEPFEAGPAEIVYWYRLDNPPVLDDGSLDPIGAIVMCDTMPGAVFQRIGPDEGNWFGPSADFTIHLLGPARPGWLLAHNRARHAGDGYASVDMALWDPTDRHLVAYATQMMFFAFDA